MSRKKPETTSGACFFVSVERDNIRGHKCFEVSLERLPCFEMEPDFGEIDEPVEPEEKEMEAPFIVYGIHIRDWKLYMVVKERDPDKEDDGEKIWVDHFGASNRKLPDGRFAYVPMYWPLKFFRAYYDPDDPDGTAIQFTTDHDTDGRLYMIFDEDPGFFFYVEYSTDSSDKIIVGNLNLSAGAERYYMDYYGEFVKLADGQAGEGCFITGNEKDGPGDWLLFRDANGKHFKVDPLYLKTYPLQFDRPNYMPVPNRAYNAKATGCYNLETGTGEKTGFYKKLYTEHDVTSIMQIQHTAGAYYPNMTFGFIYYDTPPEPEKYPFSIAFFIQLTYKKICHRGGWAGVGATGHVAEGEVACFPKGDSGLIMENPDIPQCFDPAIYDNEFRFYYMLYSDPFEGRLEGKYQIQPNPKINENQIRLVAGRNAYIPIDGKLVCIHFYDYSRHIDMRDAPYRALGFAQEVCDLPENADYCYFNDVIFVADGTEIVKVYNAMPRLLPEI